MFIIFLKNSVPFFPPPFLPSLPTQPFSAPLPASNAHPSLVFTMTLSQKYHTFMSLSIQCRQYTFAVIYSSEHGFTQSQGHRYILGLQMVSFQILIETTRKQLKRILAFAVECGGAQNLPHCEALLPLVPQHSQGDLRLGLWIWGMQYRYAQGQRLGACLTPVCFQVHVPHAC